VRLSATDLLKNYLFSVLDRGGENDHELRNLEGRWEAMVGRLGAESFPDFLRVHWNSRRPFARQAELFKTIRGQVKTREAVFQLLRDMEQDLDAYLALSSPEVSDWSRELKALAGTLRTFNVRQPFPLLLSARRHFTETEFASLLCACVVISLRYLEHVLPQNPQTGWDNFTHEEAEAHAYRLGNLTLMQAGANRDLGNAAYPAKRAAYERSGLAITRLLAQEYAEWTPERIAARQVWKANQATSIWRIAQLA
jgi:hypothetical protein